MKKEKTFNAIFVENHLRENKPLQIMYQLFMRILKTLTVIFVKHRFHSNIILKNIYWMCIKISKT